MTGEAPQPGETPRSEVDPWSMPVAPATPTLEPPRPAQHTGVAAEAHQAGAQDALAALTGEPPQHPAVTLRVPDHVPAPPKESAADQPDHDHDQVDAERFNTEGEEHAYAARNSSNPAPPPDHEPSIIDLLNSIPLEPPVVGAADAVPEVMILPEPDRNRPTVSLDRQGVPGQAPSGLSRLGQARRDHARADRALQDRVRQERTAALLETSTFWTAEERRAAAWPPPETREKFATAGRPPRRRLRDPRRPVTGLLGLLALGLVAAFFAWVSAEPFWLAVGHGDRGTATVTHCTGGGVTQRCSGQFVAADGAYRVDGLALLGIEPGRQAAGTTSPARMVSSESRQAYAGGTGVLVHLRWALSFLLVLLCGLGIAGLTGARLLETAKARRAAVLLSLAGPLGLLAGFLLVAY